MGAMKKVHSSVISKILKLVLNMVMAKCKCVKKKGGGVKLVPAFIIKIKLPSAIFTVIFFFFLHYTTQMYYSCYIKGASMHDPRLNKMSEAYIKTAYHAVTIINKSHESKIQCAPKMKQA